MGSLAEELGAALDGADVQGGEGSTDAVTEVSTGEIVGDTGVQDDLGSARDDHGRFTGKQEDTDKTSQPADKAQEQAQTQTQTQANDQEQTGPAVTPPATWSAPAKALFASLPEVARKEIAKREQDYARGIQQYAEAAKGYQSMMREIQPYEAMLRSEGSNPERAIASLFKTAYILRTASPQQKGELIMQVAKQYGADLTTYFGQDEPQPGQQDLSQVQQMVHQLVSPVLQKVQSWEQSQMTAQQRQEQQMEQEVSGQIEAFQNATNEDGSPKHLYYENVRGLMSAYFAAGQAKTLEQAYDMACWATPEVRAALQADMQRSADAQRLEEAKQKAAEAKKSGFNVSGQGAVGIAGQSKNSLRDELAAQLDAATGGQRF